MLVNIERLHVPSLGAHDVADQAQKEADARGVETVLEVLGMHRARPVDRRVAQARDVIQVELPRRQPDIVDARESHRNRAIVPVLLLHDMWVVDVKATVGARVLQHDHASRGILVQNAKTREILRVTHLLKSPERSRRN